MIDLISGCI